MRTLDEQIAIVESFRHAGIVVTLGISSEEVATLSDDDLVTLRAFGLTDAMLAALIDQARQRDQIFELDFTAQTVTVYTGHFG